MSFYLIEHTRGSLWWNGKRWQRKEACAKVYAFDELPERVPVKNGADIFADKTDAQYRVRYCLGGWICAVCWPILKRVVLEGTIEYGWICAVCQHSNGSHLRVCNGCDTERGSG